MAIVRWDDPWKELATMQEKMNQLFESAFPRFRGTEGDLRGGMWMPAVDIFETNGAVVVKAELPGVDKEQVGVEVKDGILTLRGERRFENEVKKENYHRVERSYGHFQRSFSLPAMVEAEKISAVLKDGVLEVRIPKKEEARPKQIQVTVT